MYLLWQSWTFHDLMQLYASYLEFTHLLSELTCAGRSRVKVTERTVSDTDTGAKCGACARGSVSLAFFIIMGGSSVSLLPA